MTLAKLCAAVGAALSGTAVYSSMSPSDLLSQGSGLTFGLIGLAVGIGGGVFAWMDSKYIRRDVFNSELTNIKSSLKRIERALENSVGRSS